jgi:hypothetical protein
VALIYCNGEHASFPSEEFVETAEFGLIHNTAIPHTVNGDPLNATKWALPSVSPEAASEMSQSDVQWTSLSEQEDVSAVQPEADAQPG